MTVLYAQTSATMNWSASQWGISVASGNWVKATKTLTPASSPSWTINALAGLTFDVNGAALVCTTNTATTAVMTTDGSVNDGTYTWSLFNLASPTDGDTAHLNGATVTMDIATVPASGTLTLLDGANIAGTAGVGQLTRAVSGSNSYAINATTITCGTSSGFISVTGAAASATLTITSNITAGSAGSAHGVLSTSTGTVAVVGNITGGSAANAQGLRITSAGIISVTGNVLGGSSTGSSGIVNAGTATITISGNLTGGSSTSTALTNSLTGAVTINGSITGGAAAAAYGLTNSSTGVVTVNSGNLINTASTSAVTGSILYNPGAGNYTQYVKTGGGTLNAFFPILKPLDMAGGCGG